MKKNNAVCLTTKNEWSANTGYFYASFSQEQWMSCQDTA